MTGIENGLCSSEQRCFLQFDQPIFKCWKSRWFTIGLAVTSQWNLFRKTSKHWENPIFLWFVFNPISESPVILPWWITTRLCPSPWTLSWFISVVTRVDEWGLYRTSYWDYKPTCNWGAPPCINEPFLILYPLKVQHATFDGPWRATLLKQNSYITWVEKHSAPWRACATQATEV